MLHPFRVLLSCDELKHVLMSLQSLIYSSADVKDSPWDETGMCSYFEGNYKQLISKRFLLVDFPASGGSRSPSQTSQADALPSKAFTLRGQTLRLIVLHHFSAELGCELILCSIARLYGLPGGFSFLAFKELKHKGGMCPEDESLSYASTNIEATLNIFFGGGLQRVL